MEREKSQQLVPTNREKEKTRLIRQEPNYKYVYHKHFLEEDRLYLNETKLN